MRSYVYANWRVLFLRAFELSARSVTSNDGPRRREQPVDYTLVLRMVFPGLAFEELDASLIQSDGDFDPFIVKDEVFGAREKVETTLRSPRGSSPYFIFALIDLPPFPPITGSENPNDVIAKRKTNG